MGKKDPTLPFPKSGGKAGYVWRRFSSKLPSIRVIPGPPQAEPGIQTLSIKSWIPGSPLRGAPE
jgi:hypothetical protein